MKRNTYLGITGGICATAAAALAYKSYVRPWHLRWGATDDEVNETLPGDGIKWNAKVQATHAISIDAPVQEVWRWLVQIGQGRGGFFSYDWLENMCGLEIHNIDEIRPDLQELKVGDFVRGAHRGWLGGRFDDLAGWNVVEMVPGRALVLFDASETSTWSFVLKPLDENKTRLIIRARGDEPMSLGGKVFHYAMMEPAHFVMERKMLLKLKELAEASWHSPAVPIPDERRPLEATASC